MGRLQCAGWLKVFRKNHQQRQCESPDVDGRSMDAGNDKVAHVQLRFREQCTHLEVVDDRALCMKRYDVGAVRHGCTYTRLTHGGKKWPSN